MKNAVGGGSHQEAHQLEGHKEWTAYPITYTYA